MAELAIQLDELHKTYHLDKTSLHVLRGVSLSVARGKFVAIVGASGSGKSTLLHLVGLLDRPDKGTIRLDSVDTSSLSWGRRNHIRCLDVGFVFQFYHLLGELNVLENVLLPGMVDKSIASWPGGRASM